MPDTVLSWVAPGTQSAGAGSGMGGQFSNAAAGVAGYGGAIAKQSMGKARDEGQKAYAGSGKGKQAAAQKAVDHDKLVKKLGGGNEASNKGV